MIVNNREELEGLADGTIITWLRIPGDRTSEAVAFVRSEVDYDTPTAHGGPVRTIWISPGGWHPMSVAEAGVRFPVVAFTDPTNAEPMDPSPLDFGGGTWPREAALAAAARVYQGAWNEGRPSWVAGYVTATADLFVDWLTRDSLAEALNDAVHPLTEETPDAR